MRDGSATGRELLRSFLVATRQSARTRAKDSDRDQTCKVLDEALAEGQLSMAEHGERVKAATAAATLGELWDLVSDLQTVKPSAPIITKVINRHAPSPGAGATWGIRAAVAAVLVVLGIVIGWGVYGTSSSPLGAAADPGAAADGIAPVVLTPPRQLHSLGGLSGLMEQMKLKFGDTTGYRLVVYPDYASLDRPDPAEERRKLNYSYRGGWDDPSTSTRTSRDIDADLGAFDLKAVIGVLRGAPETVGLKPAEVDTTYLIIEPTETGELQISVYVSSDFGSGSIVMHADGSTKRISYPG
jgi:hypothetical protein